MVCFLVFSDPSDFDVLEQFGTNKGVSIWEMVFGLLLFDNSL